MCLNPRLIILSCSSHSISYTFFNSIDKTAAPQDEPKFIVFQSMLLSLFSLFCFKCKKENPPLEISQTGTLVKVTQHCNQCKSPYTWSSQPLVLGQYPAGNILLSFATLASGASISKVLLLFRHMGLCCYKARTFFRHQKKFIFPSIIHHWERYRETLLHALRPTKNLIWSGDGRFDSMGHNAKYGIYSMFCSSNSKIVHFELLQVCMLKIQFCFLHYTTLAGPALPMVK